MLEQSATNEAGHDVASRPECRALVPVDPSASHRGSERPQADFVAQLIACKRRAPAYRQARMAEPAAAASAYSTAIARSPVMLDRFV